MVASVNDPADIVNNALARMGSKLRVGSLYEGSMQAKKFLDVYSQTRDELLRTQDWGFAYRSVDMNLLKQAPSGGYVPPNTWTPAYPALPYMYEYEYPNDCLRVRAVKPVPIFIPNFDPQTHVFSIANDDTYTPSKKVILCNVPPTAVLTYTGQITDPTQWEADFVEVLSAGLARRLAPLLASLEMAKMEAQDEALADSEADKTQG